MTTFQDYVQTLKSTYPINAPRINRIFLQRAIEEVNDPNTLHLSTGVQTLTNVDHRPYTQFWHPGHVSTRVAGWYPQRTACYHPQARSPTTNTTSLPFNFGCQSLKPSSPCKFYDGI